MSDLSRYTRNRSLWKKVSSQYTRQKPRIELLVDQVTEVSYSLDLTKTTRFRSPYLIDKGFHYIQPSISFVTGEYEEGLISFNDEDGVIFSFVTPFSGTPKIVISPESTSNGNYNVFCYNVTSESVYVGASIEFTGDVRYRAVYAPTYPVIVSSSYSSSFVISADSCAIVEDSNSGFSGTFATGFNNPVAEARSSVVFIGDYTTDTVDSNVAFVSFQAVNNSSIGNVTGSVSAPLSNLNEINYLVVLTDLSEIEVAPQN